MNSQGLWHQHEAQFHRQQIKWLAGVYRKEQRNLAHTARAVGLCLNTTKKYLRETGILNGKRRP